MVNVVRHKVKIPSNGTRKIFGIIRNKENFQNSVEVSSTFSAEAMAKTFLGYERQEELVRDMAIVQSRCLTRLL